MKHLEYLNDRHVRDFIHWSVRLVAGARGIDHSWTNGRTRRMNFTSLHDAVEQFEWQGTSFEWVAGFFDQCRDELQRCMDADPAREADRDGRFKEAFKDRNRRIMALQCALFMLGYESLDPCAVSK